MCLGGGGGGGPGGLITGLCAVVSPLVSGYYVVSDINVIYDCRHSDGGALLGLQFKVERVRRRVNEFVPDVKLVTHPSAILLALQGRAVRCPSVLKDGRNVKAKSPRHIKLHSLLVSADRGINKRTFFGCCQMAKTHDAFLSRVGQKLGPRHHALSKEEVH